MKRIILAVAALALIVACRYEPGVTSRTATAQAAAATTAAPTTQATPEPTTPAPVTQTLTGKVAETFDAAGYTYVRITTEKGDKWAAVKQVKLEKGADVTVNVQMTMANFESTSLKRKFDEIAFGTLGGAPGGMPPATGDPAADAAHGSMGMGDMQGDNANPHASGMMGMGGKPADMPAVPKVPKAEGSDGRTVEEIWAQKATIDGKNVVVRGVVVKFLPGIMGKNWIHLRDGSGSDAKSDNDITITTDATVAKGDTIVVSGKVGTDKDIGAGYKYGVIIEDAKIKK